jgi:nucleoside-diphosphate-sugar epimerase
MHILLFGPGFVGARLADALADDGALVWRFGREQDSVAVTRLIAEATHIVSTVAPTAEAGDPVLAAYGAAIAAASAWRGYVSSTGVYGDCGGAWVDESAPLLGRRPERIAADLAWQRLGACVLRLPGIYGPGRSVLDRLRAGTAHRIDLADQVFSRIHVDDVVAAATLAVAHGATGVFNLADDRPAPQNRVVEQGAALLGIMPPPLQSPGAAALSPAARAFYDENRRVAAGKAHRLLGWRPRYPDYQAGLRALIATSNPTSVSPQPASATGVQA